MTGRDITHPSVTCAVIDWMEYFTIRSVNGIWRIASFLHTVLCHSPNESSWHWAAFLLHPSSFSIIDPSYCVRFPSVNDIRWHDVSLRLVFSPHRSLWLCYFSKPLCHPLSLLHLILLPSLTFFERIILRFISLIAFGDMDHPAVLPVHCHSMAWLIFPSCYMSLIERILLGFVRSLAFGSMSYPSVTYSVTDRPVTFRSRSVKGRRMLNPSSLPRPLSFFKRILLRFFSVIGILRHDSFIGPLLCHWLKKSI